LVAGDLGQRSTDPTSRESERKGDFSKEGLVVIHQDIFNRGNKKDNEKKKGGVMASAR